MPKEKQYAVEVLERYQHGKYGKECYFGLYVPGFSKRDAEDVAIETLAGMTFEEIDSRCIKQGWLTKPWHISYIRGDRKTPIGMQMARAFFTCRAYIEK